MHHAVGCRGLNKRLGGGGQALVETARLGRLVHAYVQTQWAAMEALVRVRKHKRRASKFCAT